jgi:hypothetical protein
MRNRINTLATLCALSLAMAQTALAEPTKRPSAARMTKPSPQANNQHTDGDGARDETPIKTKSPVVDSYTCSGGACETQARGGNPPTPPRSSYTCSGGTCE